MEVFAGSRGFCEPRSAPNEYWDGMIFTGLLIANIYGANNEYWYVINLMNTGPFSNRISRIIVMCFALLVQWSTSWYISCT